MRLTNVSLLKSSVFNTTNYFITFALLLLISLLIIFYPIPSVLIMYFIMVYALVYDYVSTHEKLNNQYQTFKNKWKEDDSNISKNI